MIGNSLQEVDENALQIDHFLNSVGNDQVEENSEPSQYSCEDP